MGDTRIPPGFWRAASCTSAIVRCPSEYQDFAISTPQPHTLVKTSMTRITGSLAISSSRPSVWDGEAKISSTFSAVLGPTPRGSRPPCFVDKISFASLICLSPSHRPKGGLDSTEMACLEALALKPPAESLRKSDL